MSTVSLCVVTYNSQRFIDRCLRSVHAQTYEPIDVLLIDNASIDSTATYLADQWPRYRLIQNSENVGFANAHNQGIAATDGKYYMTLNPDVVLQPDYVAQMVEVMESAVDVGWVCGKLFWSSEAGGSQRLYSVGHALSRDAYPLNIGLGQTDLGQYNALREVFGATGAASLYRREMLKDIQVKPGEYFDASIFLYLEDVDLDWRARLLGWRCLYTPFAVGSHIRGASGGAQNPLVTSGITGTRYYIALKYSFPLDLILYVLPLFILQCLFLIIAEPRRRGIATLRIVLQRLPRIATYRRWLARRRRLTRQELLDWFEWSRGQCGDRPLTAMERFLIYRVNRQRSL